MTEYAIAALVCLLLLVGALFSLIAAIGLVRFPDVYARMHAASKAGTVGSGLLLLAAGVYSGHGAIFFRAMAGFAFFILTAPVAAHLVAKAAHGAGYAMSSKSARDDMRERKNIV